MSLDDLPAVTLPRALQAALLWRDPIGQLRRWSRRLGPIFTVSLPSAGEVVLVGDPTAAREILTSDPALSHTGSATGRVLPLLGGGCVLRLDGDLHRQRRRLLNGVFHGDSLTSRADLIGAVADRELDRWRTGTTLAAVPAMQTISFTVIAELVLVARLRSLVTFRDAQARTSLRSPRSRYDPVSLPRRPGDART